MVIITLRDVKLDSGRAIPVVAADLCSSYSCKAGMRIYV